MQIKLATAALCFALPAGSLFAQAQPAQAAAQSGGASAQQQQGAASMPALLDKGVDAKKAKVGDAVVAKTVGDIVDNKGGKIPMGSKIMGHVTEVQAKDKDNQESHLAFTFDSLQPKNGGAPIPVKFELSGVAPPPQISTNGDGSPMAAPSAPAPSGGGSSSGSGGGSGSSAPAPAPSPMPSDSGSASAPTGSAAPVTGSTVRDVTLNGTTLTSTKRNVSLSGGSILLLTLVPQAAPTGASPAGQ